MEGLIIVYGKNGERMFIPVHAINRIKECEGENCYKVWYGQGAASATACLTKDELRICDYNEFKKEA